MRKKKRRALGQPPRTRTDERKARAPGIALGKRSERAKSLKRLSSPQKLQAGDWSAAGSPVRKRGSRKFGSPKRESEKTAANAGKKRGLQTPGSKKPGKKKTGRAVRAAVGNPAASRKRARRRHRVTRFFPSVLQWPLGLWDARRTMADRPPAATPFSGSAHPADPVYSIPGSRPTHRGHSLSNRWGLRRPTAAEANDPSEQAERETVDPSGSTAASYPLMTLSDLRGDANPVVWGRIQVSLPETYRIPDSDFLSILSAEAGEKSS